MSNESTAIVAAASSLLSLAEASMLAPSSDSIKLPSPMKKTRWTSYQVQVARKNEKKQKGIHTQVHMRATNLMELERKKPVGEARCSTQANITLGDNLTGPIQSSTFSFRFLIPDSTASV